LSSKFAKSKKLMIFEMIAYGIILVWFLYTFLPVGLE
jgi:hypothetical protein